MNSKNKESSILSNLVLRYDNRANDLNKEEENDGSKQDGINKLALDKISSKILGSKLNMTRDKNDSNNNKPIKISQNPNSDQKMKLNEMLNINLNDFMKSRFKDVFEGLVKVIYCI
jgi:hypothetical protein